MAGVLYWSSIVQLGFSSIENAEIMLFNLLRFIQKKITKLDSKKIMTRLLLKTFYLQ